MTINVNSLFFFIHTGFLGVEFWMNYLYAIPSIGKCVNLCTHSINEFATLTSSETKKNKKIKIIVAVIHWKHIQILKILSKLKRFIVL